MLRTAAVATVVASTEAFMTASKVPARGQVNMMDQAGLETLAKAQNPALGYFDPLGLASSNFWEQSDEATIGFLRHAEIKHGRAAMMGFVGYIVHENGIRWPWALTLEQSDYSAYEGLSAPAVWDAIPEASKWQIILVIGFFEFWSESRYVLESEGQKHYMKGGKPGYFPTFDQLPHPVPLNYFDPLKLSKNMNEETKAKRLNMEVNNGRLAMIGLFGFLSEAKVPGSVPALSGIVKPYDGDIMAPFAANFHMFS